MSAVLRTARTLLSGPAMIMLSFAYGLVWLVPPGPKTLQVVTGLLFIVGLAVLSLRIAKVSETGVWRLLPDGHRTIIRAIGLIMLALTLLPGRIGDGALLNPLSGVPLGLKIANAIFFTLLGVLLFYGIGRRLPRLAILAYLFGCVVSLHYMIVGFADVPAFWFAAGGLCVAAWLYAAFGRRPLLAGAVSQRLSDVPVISKVASTRIRMPFIPNSPARELLRSRRRAHIGLPFAALIVVGWAAFQHWVLGGRIPDDRAFYYPAVLSVTLFLVVLLSQDVGAGARTLWLRWGDSRGELFGLAERTLFRDAAILCTIAWGTVTLLAMLEGPPVDATGALKMLAAHFGAAVAPIYLALAFPTFNVGWQRLVCAAACAGAVTLLSFRWLDALGYGRQGIGRIDVELLLILFLIVLTLRSLASWRWRTVDWAYFRKTRRR